MREHVVLYPLRSSDGPTGERAPLTWTPEEAGPAIAISAASADSTL